ncbi:SH2 domain-containing protein 3C-like [Pitangus sulphuratus]|nr:SH2 domain-containing protein 3C-like [Pitangus sulphuratus]
MAEGQKRGASKKFKFFKFKGFGSLSSIPRSFTFRRTSVVPSCPETLGPHLPPPRGFLEEPFDSIQDDLSTMPKSPGPYARSSDMYSHMGTMPRLNLDKAGKSLGKGKSGQNCREKGIPSNKTPQTALLPSLKSPKMSSPPCPGTDSPPAAGQADQEEEKAQPVDSPGAAIARMDQKPLGNVSCPGRETLNPSQTPLSKPRTEAPNPNPSPRMATGAEPADRDLLENRQNRPHESSPDSHHDGLESGSEYVKVVQSPDPSSLDLGLWVAAVARRGNVGTPCGSTNWQDQETYLDPELIFSS